MVKKTSDVTVTKYRGLQAVNKVLKASTGGVQTSSNAKKTKENLKVRIGTVVRFYPATDKVSVKLTDTDKTVRCVMLHNMVSGECNISFTPMGSGSMDTEYNEFSVIPYNTFYAAVLNIKDTLNKDEYCCIGFISKNDTVIKNNAERGEYLIENDTSKVSVKQGEINIKSKKLYLNGNEIITKDSIESLYATQDTVDDTNSTITSLSSKITALENKVTSLETSNTTLQSKITALETRVSSLENPTT